eukprot:2386897-Rhodomonas_salina.1
MARAQTLERQYLSVLNRTPELPRLEPLLAEVRSDTHSTISVLDNERDGDALSAFIFVLPLSALSLGVPGLCVVGPCIMDHTRRTRGGCVHRLDDNKKTHLFLKRKENMMVDRVSEPS